jgi:hypothetical protein
MRTATETTEFFRQSRAKYDAYIARKALTATHRATLDHRPLTRDQPGANIALNVPHKSGEYNFVNGRQVNKIDWTQEPHRTRMEGVIIAAKAVERRVQSLEDTADFRRRGGQMPSNKGPTAARYATASKSAALTPIESAGQQAAISMRPDISSGSQSKKTQERPMGDAAKCSCGQPRGKCGCGTTDKRLAPSAVMNIKPSVNVLPFAAINKNLVALEGAAMSAMKKQIERGMIGRGF